MDGTTRDLSDERLRAGARELLPTLIDELGTLVRIPSIATEGFPAEPLFEAHDLLVTWLRAAGVTDTGDLALWDTDPFEPVQRDGAVYGRGTADSKANIVSILGALRLFDGEPPVTVRIVLEGQEEFGSPFDFYPPKDPERFRAAAMACSPRTSRWSAWRC